MFSETSHLLDILPLITTACFNLTFAAPTNRRNSYPQFPGCIMQGWPLPDKLPRLGILLNNLSPPGIGYPLQCLRRGAIKPLFPLIPGLRPRQALIPGRDAFKLFYSLCPGLGIIELNNSLPYFLSLLLG